MVPSALPRRQFSLDALIAEAKRRARQRRFLAAFSALVLVGLAAGLTLGLPASGGGSSGAFATNVNVSALTIPTGADGIAAIVYGRLFVTTKSGFHLKGLPVSAAALSPHAVSVAAGIGDSLVELAPSGRRLWSQPAGVQGCPAIDKACGAIAAIAWSPDGSRIAYVVRTQTRNQVLHVIWRNGTHDTVIDRTARPGQPSWRADSSALAYVGAGTRPIVYDLTHQSPHLIHGPIARSPATHLAFAPHGNELAIGTETAALLVGARNQVVWRGQTEEVGWLGNRLAVSERIGTAAGRYVTRLYTFTHSAATPSRSTRLPAPILAIHGRAVALRAGTSVLAGRIGSLHKVLRFTLKPCYDSAGALVCEIPIGDQDLSLG
jgi:hypothetical protein